MRRVGVPRRHAAVVDHFEHRVRPRRDVVIVGQRERRDLTLAVAADAVLLQDRRDVCLA